MREYVYLGLMPVAYVDHSGANPVTYYVHTDQVMRPRKLTDGTGAVLWDRIATPFGDEHTVTGTLTQKLQFPGQIEDSETAFFQNWHREYDPELGRYVQSDPIGLLGGINTYGYVGGNPVMYVDPMGLDFKEPGTIGAGRIVGSVPNGFKYVVDLPPDPTDPAASQVLCGCGTPPEGSDVDFFSTPDLPWTKIIDGNVRFRGPGGLPNGNSAPISYPTSAGGNRASPVAWFTSSRALWWIYGEIPTQGDSPGTYMGKLNSGEQKSIDDSCIGFID